MAVAVSQKDQDRKFARVFKALGDPTRQRILAMLGDRPHHVGEIVEGCEVSQPTISRHLSVLRSAGLVTDQRKGQQVYYSIDAGAVVECCGGFVGNLACCDELVTISNFQAN